MLGWSSDAVTRASCRNRSTACPSSALGVGQHLQRDVASQARVGRPGRRRPCRRAPATPRSGTVRPACLQASSGSSSARSRAASARAGVSRNPSTAPLEAASSSATCSKSGCSAAKAARSLSRVVRGRRQPRVVPFGQHAAIGRCSQPSSLGQLVMEPGARGVPVVDDGAHRHAERLRRLLDREPTEESQLDDLARPRVDRRQVVQGVVRGRRRPRRVPAPRRRPPRATVASTPCPRLTACRARAASTSTRRIIRAVVAKKCARFCQCTARQSSRRT